MARPPLSPEELAEQAMFILVGQAERVEQDGADVEMAFRIEATEKFIVPLDKDVVTVHFNRGLGDDEGQHSMIFEGERVRLFVRASMAPGGRLELLEPNGWEPA